MKKAFSLILICLFFYNNQVEAQSRPRFKGMLLSLLTCQNEEELKGNVHSVTTKYGNSEKEKKLEEYHYSEYNEENQIISSFFRRVNAKEYYRYDANSKLTNIITYRKEILQDSIVFIYNDEGALKNRLIYDADKLTIKETIEIHYDSTGMPVRTASRRIRATQLERVLEIGDTYIDIFSVVNTRRGDTSRYSFDLEKRCINRSSHKKVINSVDGKTRIEIRENVTDDKSILFNKYEYDSIGNWVRLKIYNVKKGKEPKPRDLLSLYVREIEYR